MERSTGFCLILRLHLDLFLGHSWKRLSINPAIFPTYSEKVDHEEMKTLSIIWKTLVKLSCLQQGMSNVLLRVNGSITCPLFLPPPSMWLSLPFLLLFLQAKELSSSRNFYLQVTAFFLSSMYKTTGTLPKNTSKEIFLLYILRVWLCFLELQK